MQSLSQVNFFSFLMNGSTGAGNEQEMVLVAFCGRYDKTKEIRSQTLDLPDLNPASSLLAVALTALQMR